MVYFKTNTHIKRNQNRRVVTRYDEYGNNKAQHINMQYNEQELKVSFVKGYETKVFDISPFN